MSNNSKFSRCLIALLAFYKTGDFQTFKVVLYRAFDYLNLSISDESFKRISYILFNRLTTFGILETARHKGRTMWDFCGPSVLEVAENEFFFIADQVAVDRVADSLDKKTEVFEHIICKIPDKFLPGSFSFVIPKFLIKSRTPKDFDSSKTISVVDLKKFDLFKILPPIEKVSSEITEDESFLIPENNSLEIFNFKKMNWVSISLDSLEEKGFYRMTNPFREKSYFVTDLKGKVKRLPGKEWAFFLACFILGIKLRLVYNNKTGILEVPHSCFNHSPLIVKRALIMPSFEWPDFKNGYYHISEIKSEKIIQLSAMMKIFRISYE